MLNRMRLLSLPSPPAVPWLVSSPASQHYLTNLPVNSRIPSSWWSSRPPRNSPFPPSHPSRIRFPRQSTQSRSSAQSALCCFWKGTLSATVGYTKNWGSTPSVSLTHTRNELDPPSPLPVVGSWTRTGPEITRVEKFEHGNFSIFYHK